ncbi:hypothetical protein C0J50_12934 [Silurus asotus]|uniref:HTH CENPB-type domain-containing protein n=1 Tax=Silurus asotus TaxID=30991 RepID=A0AAD5FSX2_SILAS|nr:hypothetical protein C0J50_12934 [Silurus asotus]
MLYENFAVSDGEEGEDAGPSASAADTVGEDARPPASAADKVPSAFNASKGWFEKFKKRFGLKNVCLHGEMASAEQ